MRVPPEVAAGRRRQLNEEARKKGQTVSARGRALADWTLLVTNAPATLLTLDEALVLGRARWQIELLFKLWKSHGQVDESRRHKPWRVLCEVYAKLIALVIQHWVIITGCWRYPARRLVKALHTVRKHALHLAAVFHRFPRLCEALTVIHRCLRQGCRLNPRKAKPNTYQLLLQLTRETDEFLEVLTHEKLAAQLDAYGRPQRAAPTVRPTF